MNGETDLEVVEDDLIPVDGGDPDLEDVCTDDATYISNVQAEPYFGAPLRRFIDAASCEFFSWFYTSWPNKDTISITTSKICLSLDAAVVLATRPI